MIHVVTRVLYATEINENELELACNLSLEYQEMLENPEIKKSESLCKQAEL